MIEQNVQVIACRPGSIQVRLGPDSGCSACDQGKGCGAGVFARLLQRKPVVLELKRNQVDVEPGQMVTLCLPEQTYLRLVFASYGWPLLAALAGATAGYGFATWLKFDRGPVDGITLLGGVLFALLALRYLRAQDDRGINLNYLSSMDYFSAERPHMCNRDSKQSQEL